MSETGNGFTVVLPSQQAACISGWLQKLSAAPAGEASPELLAAFAAQLDDARWIGRWLREEARLGILCNDSIAIGEALREAMKRAKPSEQEQLALKHLVDQLERGVLGQSPQFACPSPLALASADTAR